MQKCNEFKIHRVPIPLCFLRDLAQNHIISLNHQCAAFIRGCAAEKLSAISRLHKCFCIFQIFPGWGIILSQVDSIFFLPYFETPSRFLILVFKFWDLQRVSQNDFCNEWKCQGEWVQPGVLNILCKDYGNKDVCFEMNTFIN